MPHWVFSFGDGSAEGGLDQRSLLGSKGGYLAEMAALGLPVPPGFTITTDVCRHFYAHRHGFPAGLDDEVAEAVSRLEARTGRRFGGKTHPLLVAVRSGALETMPGMMDTVLNLGLNDVTVEALADEASDRRFALDSYRRFIQMFGDVVLGVDQQAFEEILDDLKERGGYFEDDELSVEDWGRIVDAYKQLVIEESGAPFPQDPQEQLWRAIEAVFGSWNNTRAVTFRKLHSISPDAGTAVNVQAMVFGNMDGCSATGVAYTRNPTTGENQLNGEFLINAQGEDVIAGIRTPQEISESSRIASRSDRPSLETLMPETYREFVGYCRLLEKQLRDVQNIEFTIEHGKLWILQTRPSRRTGEAALRIAVEMAEDGLISQDEALERIDPDMLIQLLHPTVDPNAHVEVLATGLPASPGAATGEIVFSADEAERSRQRGIRPILVRIETSPEDIQGMHSARGILTARGGMTSHAAVVARGMGKPCVSGVGSLKVDIQAGTMTLGGRTVKRGEVITIDGATGRVMLGAVPMREPELSGAFGTLMSWADGVRRMRVRTNAETPADVRVAAAFGAEGIGLCRTEHMFFDHPRIMAVREMILAETPESRRTALAKLLPMQRQDFIQIFEIMKDRPVCIRLLDPPLHEFLPDGDADIAELAATFGVDTATMRKRIEDLNEVNPMLGHRGCRLAVSYPEIAEMQGRAIFEAALEAEKVTGVAIVPEIMVPLVSTRSELDYVGAILSRVACDIERETGRKVAFRIGTMIELPRAALMAGDIARSATFFSFGTNDLTQTAFGISRDDAASFLPTYVQKGLLPRDPFISIDREGVGEFIRIAIDRGRQTRPELRLSICGEHGGDPNSIAFCEELGLTYVSCSPFRVPIARLAAAQAVLALRKANAASHP